MAALQIGLFRTIGDLAYVPIASTGNLMRLVESGYSGIVDNRVSSRRAVAVYASLIATFAVGALVGAFPSRLLDVHAIWLPAAVLLLTLAMLVIDEHRRRRGRRIGAPDQP